MAQRAFVESGLVKDLGPDMPAYPDDMVFDVPDGAKLGWVTADGGKTFAAPAETVSGPVVRSVQAYTLLMAIPLDKRDLYGSAVKGWDQRRMSARGSDLIPENSPLIARVAPLISFTPKAWFDLALGVSPS